MHRLPAWHRLAAIAVAFGLVPALLGGCAEMPPRHQDNLCKVFDQHPDWYDYAHESQRKWGVPIQIQMAFIKRESSFHEGARPPRHWFLGFIPLPRHSSAYGYGQIQDPVWHQYLKANPGWFQSRTDMEDVLDFIGWYDHESHEKLGISVWDTEHLYIAYHEGWAGYRAGRWRHDRHLLRTAHQVAGRASDYGAQLRRCEHRFRCRHFWQIGPFCK